MAEEMRNEEEEEKKVSVVVDWLQLPEHITSQIVNKFTCFSDCLRFSYVCVKWQSLILDDYCIPLPAQLPLLMIPTPSSSESIPLPPDNTNDNADDNTDDNENKKKKKKKNKNKMNNNNNNISDSSSSSNVTTTKSFTFYRITDGEIYHQLQLTMPSERYWRGSGQGWLITVDNVNFYPVKLINPFPSPFIKEINLPQLITLPKRNKSGVNDPIPSYFHLRRAVLSADPIANPRSYMVMVIYGEFGRLAFFKPGGKKVWTPINDDNDPEGLFDDITYYKGKFYASHYQGAVVECDLVTRTATTIAGPPICKDEEGCRVKRYLVESSGELLQVLRYIIVEDGHSYSTIGFQVFKLLPLNPTGNRRTQPGSDWVEVKDLGARAVFIGDNASMSISSSNFPRCKPNRIYFTDDSIYLYFVRPQCCPHDIGVYFLENRSFENHYMAEFARTLPAPVWVEPTLPPRKINLSA